MTTLKQFLNAHKAATNYTHLSLSPNGKYRIEESELPTLYSLVSSTPGIQHILERHNETGVGPLLIDLDFEYPEEPRFHTRQYKADEIDKFVEAIHDAVQYFFGTQNVEYVISEKPVPTVEVGKRVKDGIHILGRGLQMTYADQHKLRLYLLEKHVLQNSFSTEHIRNAMEDVYDKAVIETNSWYLLGCAKPDRDPYLPTIAYSVPGDDLARRFVDRSTFTIADLSIRAPGSAISALEEKAREWNAIEPLKKRIVKKKVAEDPAPQTISHVMDDDSDTIRTGVSESISKILKTRGLTWQICDCDGGFQLKHNANECLVAPEYTHSQLGHSCVFVQRGCATLSCFSHKTKKIPKAKGAALWRLLTEGEEEVLIDDLYACKKFVECMADEIHREGDLVYVFDPATGMWSTKESDLIAAVHRHKDALTFRQSNAEGHEVVYNYGGCTKNIKNMLVHLRPILADGKFISSHMDGSLAYLLFEDGIFHIPTQTFTAGFDKTKVFAARIARKFPSVRDAAVEALVNEKLFELPLQNTGVGRYLKMRLARSIAGCYRDKRFVCVLGEADCSKGTLTYAMRRAFGDFVMEYNANHLKYNARSGADEAKKLSWLIPIMNARLAISNEVRMDKVPIDGNLLKSLSSGGDEMGARQNFKDEHAFVPKVSFFFMGNDMPEIAPKDSGIETRVRVVRFNKRFVARPTGPNELLADETIKDKLETDEWKNAIFWLIMDAYGFVTTEPVEVCEETREWIPSGSAEFRGLIEENFVINLTDVSPDNYVASKDIIAFIKERGLNMSDTKIGRELGKLGLVKEDKKVDGKTIKIWRGIK
jgi:hypothetical protein